MIENIAISWKENAADGDFDNRITALVVCETDRITARDARSSQIWSPVAIFSRGIAVVQTDFIESSDDSPTDETWITSFFS